MGGSVSPGMGVHFQNIGGFTLDRNMHVRFAGDNNQYMGDDKPAVYILWDHAKGFTEKLSQATGKSYRLPSEAEWEFAARGGIHSEGYIYSGSNKLEEVGWYKENSESKTYPVGEKLPNELGIYDMSGNIYEWCEDDYFDTYKGAPKNGKARKRIIIRTSARVLRGGAYLAIAEHCRASCRSTDGLRYNGSDVGFRLALSPSSI